MSRINFSSRQYVATVKSDYILNDLSFFANASS